jgi:anti-sigma B factor antagonist
MAELGDNGDDGAHASVATDLQSDGVPVIRIDGELDISNVSAIEQECDVVVKQSPGRVVFDLATLRFIDSSGIAMLLRAAQSSEVEVRNASNMIRRIIAATGLTDVLHVEHD